MYNQSSKLISSLLFPARPTHSELIHGTQTSGSQPAPTQLKRKAPFPLSSQMLFEDEDEDLGTGDDVADELIVTMQIEVVGIQYYTGIKICPIYVSGIPY